MFIFWLFGVRFVNYFILTLFKNTFPCKFIEYYSKLSNLTFWDLLNWILHSGIGFHCAYSYSCFLGQKFYAWNSMSLLGARVVVVLLLLLLLLFENWNVTGWIPLWYLNFWEADQYIDIVWTISLSLSDLLKMFACVICRSSHVLPCRPSGITLDIKKSSHKKLSKWLQSKSSAGLVNVIYFNWQQ